MNKETLLQFFTLIAAFGVACDPLQAALVIDFNANNTSADVTVEDSQNYTIDNTSGNGPIGITYNETSTVHAGIRNFSGNGLRIRNTTDGGIGTALFGFDLGGSYVFTAGADDDIVINTGGNTLRIDDAGTGTRVALENAGAWYVSEEIHLTGTSNVNALELDWFQLGGNTIAGITNIAGGATSAASFTNITTAGVWIEMLGMNGGGSPNSNYGVQEFQFNATASAVPEPTSFAFISLAIAGGIIARRKRTSKSPSPSPSPGSATQS
ncbi:PEP-CTERM sorting domain-containing protein [Neorhodopirellula pilleata]|nr:PEP-CTERM sorting domain-containing protein [Neorhodopirellula pilleata]